MKTVKQRVDEVLKEWTTRSDMSMKSLIALFEEAIKQALEDGEEKGREGEQLNAENS